MGRILSKSGLESRIVPWVGIISYLLRSAYLYRNGSIKDTQNVLSTVSHPLRQTKQYNSRAVTTEPFRKRGALQSSVCHKN